MIITNINGGIGNQLFQYALGRVLAIKNNDVLKIDTSDLLHNQKFGAVPRYLDLTKFNISAELATKDEATKLRDPYGLPSFIIRRLRMKFISCGETGYEPKLLTKTGDVYLDGYFQSYKYFEANREMLLSELTLKDNLSPAALHWQNVIQKQPTTVSLHVRRGDYVSNESTRKSFGPCPIDYYIRAMQTIEERVTTPTYVIFSDDIEWVKAHLPLPDTALLLSDKSITAVEDLVLMSNCTHNIIANSSFSWWGAWLNKNPDKIVITPTPWLDNGLLNEDDLIPTEWTRIDKYSTTR